MLPVDVRSKAPVPKLRDVGTEIEPTAVNANAGVPAIVPSVKLVDPCVTVTGPAASTFNVATLLFTDIAPVPPSNVNAPVVAMSVPEPDMVLVPVVDSVIPPSAAMFCPIDMEPPVEDKLNVPEPKPNTDDVVIEPSASMPKELGVPATTPSVSPVVP